VRGRGFAKVAGAGFLLVALGWACQAQALIAELKTEHDPARRSEKALVLADEAFEDAKDMYNKGEVHKADARLDDMTTALKECVDSLDEAHKAKFYKKAELRVAFLQRRMQGLVDELSIQERGWAEYTNRKLDELHEKMLDGVMRK
jgi:site-specific recombinase